MGRGSGMLGRGGMSNGLMGRGGGMIGRGGPTMMNREAGGLMGGREEERYEEYPSDSQGDHMMESAGGYDGYPGEEGQYGQAPSSPSSSPYDRSSPLPPASTYQQQQQQQPGGHFQQSGGQFQHHYQQQQHHYQQQQQHQGGHQHPYQQGGGYPQQSLGYQPHRSNSPHTPPPSHVNASSPSPSSSSSLTYISPTVREDLTAGDPIRCISALKHLEGHISSHPEWLLGMHEGRRDGDLVSGVVEAISLKIHLTFTSHLPLPGSPEYAVFVKLCKHLVNCLVQIFSRPILAREVREGELARVLEELLQRLLDQGLQAWEASGTQLTRALNMLMIRILDNSDRNLTFPVLLALLRQGAMGLRAKGERVPGEEEDGGLRFTELVMKCLWKLTKTLQDNIYRGPKRSGPEENLEEKMERDGRVRSDDLLLALHRFLLALPPSEWKRRTAAGVPLGDMPLRTVKTILHEIKSVWGAQVLEEIPPLECVVEKSYIYQYLSHMVGGDGSEEGGGGMRRRRSGGKGGGGNLGDRPPSSSSSISSFSSASSSSARRWMAHEEGDRDGGGIHRRDSPLSTASASSPTASSPSTASRAVDPSWSAASREEGTGAQGENADVVMQKRVREIFVKISTRQHTKAGIAQLYAFQRAHPEAQGLIDAHLSKSGTYFQSYIRRSLANLEAEDRENGEEGAGAGGGDGRTRGNGHLRRASTLSTVSNGSYTSTGSYGSMPSPASMMSRELSHESNPRYGMEDVAKHQERLSRLQEMFGYTSKGEVSSMMNIGGGGESEGKMSRGMR